MTKTEYDYYDDLYVAIHPNDIAIIPEKKHDLMRDDIRNTAPIKFPGKLSSPRIVDCGAPAGFWREGLPLSKTATLKRKRGDSEPSTVRQKARRQGATAYLTVALQKPSGLKFTWHDSAGGYGTEDMVTYSSGYNRNSAEFEAIEAHDAYWENATGSYNRQYVVALACLRTRQLAKSRSGGDSGCLQSATRTPITLSTLHPDDKPDRPVEKVTYLFNAEQRTVALMAGAVEEQEIHDDRAASLIDTPIPAVVIQDPFSA
ncbi:hypothetical protein ACHAPA_003451 [Fusarium lateritium]